MPLEFTRKEIEELRREYFKRNTYPDARTNVVASMGRPGIIHKPGSCSGVWNPLDVGQVKRLLKEGRARLCLSCGGPDLEGGG